MVIRVWDPILGSWGRGKVTTRPREVASPRTPASRQCAPGFGLRVSKIKGQKMEDIHTLMTRFPRPGRLEWIGVRGRRRGQVLVVDEVLAQAGVGLLGDHYRPGVKGSRQVTLIQAEHLPVIAALTGRPDLKPGLLRRNLAVSGINLLALKGMRFQVGAALLEGTGLCHPCSRMEEVLGPGAYNAMRGHGGLTARVLESGLLCLGDPVVALGPVEGVASGPEVGA